MAEKFIPIPERSKLSENGFVTTIWTRFLYSIFNTIFTRIEELETTSADHESRIETLEP